jgi:hypothetical protein
MVILSINVEKMPRKFLDNQEILDPLNDCIAAENNFQRRVFLMNSDRNLEERKILSSEKMSD